jgi:hypothetical protein
VFIGHYSAALIAKRAQPKLSLGALFLCAQFLDLLFMSLVIVGVEKVRIVPGFTEVNPYDLYFMPYSHSLVASVVWAAIVFAFFNVTLKSRAGAFAMALVVFSHFALDLPMHTPDLPLAGDDSQLLGLGLWRNRWASLAVELACVAVGVALWLRSDARPLERARGRTIAFVVVLVGLTLATPFMPDPSGPTAMAAQALAAYLALAFFAQRVDARAAA